MLSIINFQQHHKPVMMPYSMKHKITHAHINTPVINRPSEQQLTNKPVPSWGATPLINRQTLRPS